MEILKGGKSGRSDYGRLYTLKDGTVVYLAKRNFEKTRKKSAPWQPAMDVFRNGLPDKSSAFREGKAEFALDEETLLVLLSRGCKVVGVCDEASGDVYVTSIENFFDTSVYAYHDYSARGGAPQRYVNRSYFRAKSGQVQLTTKKIDKQFNLKKRKNP